MSIINNFLSDIEYEKFVALEKQCNTKSGMTNNDDYAIQGLENTKFIVPTDEFAIWWIDILKQKKIIRETFNIKDLYLNIVEARSPYFADWHYDSYDNLPVGIVLFYFSENWCFEDGGLLLLRDNNHNNGEFVIPNKNVLVTNPTDKQHAVTSISNKEKVRKSVVMFVKQEEFL